MMKRISVFLGILMLAAFSAPFASGNIFIQGKAGYFLPTDKAFKDIYSQRLIYGGEMGWDVLGGLGIWVSGEYFQGKGKLTFTGESTKMKIIPLGVGLSYSFTRALFRPYLGVGAGYFLYEESNPIGSIKKSNVGLIGKAGLAIRPFKPLRVDLQVSYSYCKVKPAGVEADLGGLQAGLALGVEF